MSEELIILIGQLLIKYGPELAQKFIAIFHKENPTKEDWDALFALAENPIAQVSDMPNKPTTTP